MRPPNDEGMRLTAHDLSVGWHGHPIALLSEIKIAAGQISVLAGPNGAGKSTSVKTLARQIAPLSGSVQFNGQDIWTLTPRDFARAVAYVPQILDPPHGMLVRDMVALGRNPHQMWWSWERTAKDDEAIEKALQETGTAHLREKAVGTLSGGELQRATIAMALAQETQFLLLDEPTAHLDYKHQLQLVELLKQLKGKGLGILLVLHDLNLIGRLADQVLLLQRQTTEPGKIVASGSPSAVLTRQTLSDVYEIEVAISQDTQNGITTYTPLKHR